jgi:hypothetical protein
MMGRKLRPPRMRCVRNLRIQAAHSSRQGDLPRCSVDQSIICLLLQLPRRG